MRSRSAFAAIAAGMAALAARNLRLRVEPIVLDNDREPIEFAPGERCPECNDLEKWCCCPRSTVGRVRP